MKTTLSPCNDSVWIVGNGLIAEALKGVDFGRATLVLASGVSDSQETRHEAFSREVELVERMIRLHSGVHVLYCSTCSVDSGLVTPYIAHKLQVERLVMETASSCHVFRLPQVVGMVHNRTLVSHFVSSILLDRVLKVQVRAKRNLLDVRDFARVAAFMVRRDVGGGGPQNIASASQVAVIDIVTEIARLLDRPALTVLEDAGYSQMIDTRLLRTLLPADDPLFDSNHWRVVLSHYVPLIAGEIGS